MPISIAQSIAGPLCTIELCACPANIHWNQNVSYEAFVSYIFKHENVRILITLIY